ncbi:hypothetical protein [Algicella marina]|uniref:Uncharacterized protein n=1 Tax=Algicella marina TaxID=2683284 RepID=A0A6P1T1M6_9RHOB|nr:hypothetical protein [Algicella marina]QHQ35665.1 hypothetical protein GO499_11000 [Algicella marina]
MKVAILGNSHIAALKVAERDGLFSSNSMDITFFGNGAALHTVWTFRYGRVWSKLWREAWRVTDRRHFALPVRRFDALVFHGAPVRMENFYYPLTSDTRAVSGYSTAVVDRMIEVVMMEDPVFKLFLKIRSGFNGPVHISPRPLERERPQQQLRRGLSEEDLTRVHERVRVFLDSHDIGLVPQAPETIRLNQFTKNQFSIGAQRLGGDMSDTHGKQDYTHMNGAYGAIALREIEKKLVGD